MARNYGTGVSRVLDPTARQFMTVIWQQGKCPLDAEYALMSDMAGDWARAAVLRGTPSGWLTNAVGTEEDFVTDPTYSNWFRTGKQRTGEKGAILWANVNGWLVPVTGTGTGTPPGVPDDTSTWNKITLDPPPSNSGDSRIDFAFLEVWLAKVAPSPATLNKPTSTNLYRYGNVEGGMTYLADDLQDPAIGFETTQRVQLQYRIRVVSGLIGLTSYPDGFDPTVVKGRGAATADTAYTFTNMRQELGDPGLWRAGDGTSNSLATVDGYTYAIPLCGVFRRNSVAWDGDPSQNLNGAFNRNPTATDRTGVKTFSTVPTLSADLTSSALALTLTSVSNIPLPLTPAIPAYIQIGDEILTYQSITGVTMTITATGRGSLGSKAEAHKAGDVVTILSGRPDGLFSDQITKTDILDLRHAVNPNGFNYDTLLQAGLDKLLRGELRSTWKRSGGGPQGPFVLYQDKISSSAPALGVTLLDAPDGHRMVFSDAAMQQCMEFIATPAAVAGQPINTTWSLSLNGAHTALALAGSFSPTDILTIPVAQLKTGMPGGDADQVSFVSSAGAVSIRIDGQSYTLKEGLHYSITPVTGPTSDLVITLLAGFPTTTKAMYISFHVQYGPGRGLSRRPDSLHNLAFLSASSDDMVQQAGVPSNNFPLRTAWAPLWSKYRNSTFRNMLPVTAESYVDLGSKTVILTPFRKVALPSNTGVLTGTYANPNYDEVVCSGTVGAGNDTTTFTDATATFVTNVPAVVAGDIVVVSSPVAAVGEYRVTVTPVAPGGETALTLDHQMPTAANVVYDIVTSQGIMPLETVAGAAKWTTTDPLGLFCSHTYMADPNNYITLPRKLVPGWGEVRVPIIHTDQSPFYEGVNFLINATKGAIPPTTEPNYIPFPAAATWTPFTTWNFVGMGSPAAYNTVVAINGLDHAGMRFFTDTRGLGREGLELPPFYGIARLFAVYGADDYVTGGHGTNYDTTSRAFVANNSVNILRQNFDGPVFWIEIDDDGDSTFVLNAEAIDITKIPAPFTPATFAAGKYIIEASIFGFDRNTFDLNHDARIVISRAHPVFPAAGPVSPVLVIPGPAHATDEIAINYSRTPYQGDAWGSQTTQTDIAQKVGPLLTATAYQIASTELNEAALTRPNQKNLEVLASVGFVTTLGSGRLSGDRTAETFDFRNVGYEALTSWPPASAIAPRPLINTSALVTGEAGDLSTEYSNCIERLPLGALYRDKDFRGGYIAGNSSSHVRAPLVYTNSRSPGVLAASIAADQAYDQLEVSGSMSSLASGQAGEQIVHADGEQGNYGLLVNYRTSRGGSVFSSTAPHPGGEFASQFWPTGTSSSYEGVLTGTACLVRNTVTSVGATEVSAGGELMLLITTTATNLSNAAKDLQVFLGTNGTGEGHSAADLYRLPSHPLEVDNVRGDTDPSSIVLAKKSDVTF
jgi:hypothetical protein